MIYAGQVRGAFYLQAGQFLERDRAAGRPEFRFASSYREALQVWAVAQAGQGKSKKIKIRRRNTGVAEEKY